MTVSQKIGIVLLEDPAILLLSIHPKDAPQYHQDMCPTIFIVAIFIIETVSNPDIPQLKMNTAKLVHFHNGMLFSY